MRSLLGRIGHLLLVLVLVTFFTSLLVSLLPGDPVEVIVPYGTDELRHEVRQDLGLDQSPPVRYLDWVTGFATGDLGSYYALSSQRPVADAVAGAAPVSLLLVLYAQIIGLAVAIPLGVLSAARKGGVLDRIVSASGFALLAVPNFALGLVLAYYLGARLQLLPVSGYAPPGEGMLEHLQRMALPAFSLAAGQIAIYLRLLRSDMIATLQEDFILMARAKGLPPWHVLWRHALRPSSLTLLTVAGLNVGILIGGAVVIEVVFQLPGLGLLLYQAVLERQYVALQSLIALIAVVYVVLNFLVDVTYQALDPRIRHAR